MKETIIFLHGIVGNKSAFKSEIEQLRNQYCCISYNFYGPEHSEADGFFSLELLLEQLYAQYVEHGIKEAHLCALSFGCIPAIAFAKKYPHMVLSLIFVGGYYCNVPSTLQTHLIQLLKEKEQLNYKVWTRRCATLLNPNKNQIPEDSEAIFFENALLLHPNVFEKVLKLQLQFDSRSALQQIKTPILWVMGEYDELYKETLFNLKHDIPHVEYRELKNAGHVAHIHQPEQFMYVFESFITKSKILVNV